MEKVAIINDGEYHKENLTDVEIPDLWHLAMRMADSGDKVGSERVLNTWHIAHKLMDIYRELPQ